MKFQDYLKDHFTPILLFFFLLLFLFCLFLLLKLSLATNIFILSLITCFFLFSFFFNYFKRKIFFKEFLSILEKIDQKYFITEMIPTANFLEGKLFLQALYEIDKSMKEKVSESEKSMKDFKEYLELWIHEIKLPIASLILRNHNKQEKDSKELEQIKKIEEYVEQVLFYVRSEHSGKDYLIHECDLNTMIKNVVLRNKDDFLTLHISVETKNLNKKVLTDSKWFEYILNQIVSNAKKYKKEKDSMIHFEAEEDENEIKISIKDNGIGIKESDLPKVFEKSFTGENGHNTKESTGMGLFLVKKMCEQLGHQVEIESLENEYTKVTITISKNSFYNVLK